MAARVLAHDRRLYPHCMCPRNLHCARRHGMRHHPILRVALTLPKPLYLPSAAVRTSCSPVTGSVGAKCQFVHTLQGLLSRGGYYRQLTATSVCSSSPTRHHHQHPPHFMMSRCTPASTGSRTSFTTGRWQQPQQPPQLSQQLPQLSQQSSQLCQQPPQSPAPGVDGSTPPVSTLSPSSEPHLPSQGAISLLEFLRDIDGYASIVGVRPPRVRSLWHEREAEAPAAK